MDKNSFAGSIRRAIFTLIWTIVPPGAAPPASADDDFPLRYEKNLIALGFPSPLLPGTVHGERVWFIVDTGAAVNTFASWLVSAAHLEARETTASVTGSTGADTPVRLVTNQMIQLDGGRELAIREAIVVEFPQIFAEQKIGGLISPQLLAKGRTAAVLDLRVPSLRFESFDMAVASLGHDRSLTSRNSRVCRNGESQFENRLYAASVSADGIIGTMLVDTGATGTVVAPSSHIAGALKPRASGSSRTQGVGGDRRATPRVPNVNLERGGTVTTIAVTIGGTEPSCGPDGLIGMDALRRCVLVLGESQFAWSCQGSD